ncbi:unnamed protein product [Ambrosiozyma monospora]|uniref:Protein EFR3 n=1 Tax=Ambrosiozyma monospora TaxID=43982 RepID=A0A9W7DJ31_AMBMO|nr:unnamed protein product [Ambrosiozyma monospora]
MLYKPKHQKLILRCYPSKKLPGNETKPNNAELSYLIYYAKTRRTKLEKVCVFLDKKTKSDVAHGRIGHLTVTMYILQELINECTDNLGILTPTIITTLSSVLNLKDLSSSQLASNVFESYCQALQPQQTQIFSSDNALLKDFLKLSKEFIDLGGENGSEDWQRIGIQSTQVASSYVEATYTSQASLIQHCVTLLLSKLEKNASSPELVRTVTSSEQKIDTASLTIKDYAMLALKQFFDTNNKKQVDLSTKSVVGYALEKKSDLVWVNVLLEVCTKKTHIELRYRVISVLILELTKAKDIQSKSFLSMLISNLLSCEDVNMVGLPVKEILGDVLQLEKHLILNESGNQELADEYNDIVRSLSKHIYYNNQINDMVQEIFGYYYQLIATEKLQLSST